MGPKLVSVIVPTRNRADKIVECLEALARQTYPNVEAVVIDDASTDGTQQALEQFRQRYPKFALTVLVNAPQRGANPSRNRGIAASRGELIAFEDDDCIAEPDWIAHLVAGFVSDRVGAVTGIVLDPDPKNIYDLAFRGTHRVYGKVHATRLIAGNMCVRRELLAGKLDEDRAAVSTDLSVSGRGDEEDLFLKLKAEGHEIRVAHEARVLHVHYYTRKAFFRQAWKGGTSAARLGYKYHLKPRPELLCLAGGYVFGASAPLNPLNVVPSALCFSAFAGATLGYNEIVRKKKTLLQALRVAPVMAAYYHVRTAGYLTQYSRFLLKRERIERVKLVRRAPG